MRMHRWLIPVAALVAVLPLAVMGPSCGKDMPFHLQSWLDVAAQMRHGVLLPRWNFLSAYNAGEPRYVFYPPLSWLLGGALTLAMPFPWVPTALSWIAMCIAGFGMRRLLSAWATPAAAVIAACVYLANPFMMFSITARSAYGEIFAAALLPFLVLALLRTELNAVNLALPMAGILLSNVPGGVIAAYLYGAVAGARIVWGTRSAAVRLRMVSSYACGFLLAIALAAFYLLPPWNQRVWIHAAEPFVFPLRPVDSLFFARTLQPASDDFLIRVGHLAAGMAVVTFVLHFFAWLLIRWRRAASGTAASIVGWGTLLLAVTVCFMLTAPAALLWRTLPGLYILQFPWRLLMLLAMCMATALALLLRHLQTPAWATTACALCAVIALSITGSRLYTQPCEPSETPLGTMQRLVVDHHAPEPIDEYVVAGADPEMMRPDNPPFWLAKDPLAYAPATTPNRAKTMPGAAMSGVPEDARLSQTPLDFTVDAPQAGFAVVNLQAYPKWRVTRNDEAVPSRLARPDGLLVVPIDKGVAHIVVRWRHGWDEWLGGVVSLFAAAGIGLSTWRRRYAGASS